MKSNMKTKIYNSLAALSFVSFIGIAGVYTVNYSINKTIEAGTATVDGFFRDIESIDDGIKLYNNAKLQNCFPKTCAVVSQLTLMELDEESTEEELTEKVKQKGTALKAKYDVFFTSPMVAEINQLTGDITGDIGSTNVVLLKNNKDVLASAYFKNLSYNSNAGLLNHYKNITNLGEKSGSRHFNVSLVEPRVSIDEDIRVKAEELSYNIDVKNRGNKFSSYEKFNLQGLSINNEENVLDVNYSTSLLNLDSKVYKDLEKISSDLESSIDANKDMTEAELKQLLVVNLANYATAILGSFESFPENETRLVIKDFSLKERNVSEDDKMNLEIKVNADLALNDKLNPEGEINITLFNEKEEIKQVLKNLPVSSDLENSKGNENMHQVKIKFTEGKMIINEQEINIDGKVNQFLSNAKMLVSMLLMNIAMAR